MQKHFEPWVSIAFATFFAAVFFVNMYLTRQRDLSGLAESSDGYYFKYSVYDCRCNKKQFENILSKLEYKYIENLKALSFLVDNWCEFNQIETIQIVSEPESRLTISDTLSLIVDEDLQIEPLDEIALLRRYLIQTNSVSDLELWIETYLKVNNDAFVKNYIDELR